MTVGLSACGGDAVRSTPATVIHDPDDQIASKLQAAPSVSQSTPRITGLFEWPVDSARMSRGFSAKPTGKARKPHLGIDLAAPKGTPIYAAQDGVVIYTGQEFKGYGKLILIEGKAGFASLYAHLSKFIAKEGQKVVKGTVIGLMGRTGHASGNHLHFEVRKDRGAVDPLLFLPPSGKLKLRASASEDTDE